MRTFLLGMLISAVAITASAESQRFSREGIEWYDIWISHADKTNSPRVLLIGDSIAKGYYPEVEKRLSRKAYVARFVTSAFLSDPMFTQQLATVLDNTKFDVIHFNNGLHGWQHSEEEYHKAFPELLLTLKNHAPNAQLIWATTTPLKDSAKVSPGDSTQALNERVAARNSIALECLKGKTIAVNDLHALVRGHPEYYSDGVHFNRDGAALQAAQVAAQIEKHLPR